jgi:hypothetical protein
MQKRCANSGFAFDLKGSIFIPGETEEGSAHNISVPCHCHCLSFYIQLLSLSVFLPLLLLSFQPLLLCSFLPRSARDRGPPQPIEEAHPPSDPSRSKPIYAGTSEDSALAEWTEAGLKGLSGEN